MTASAAREIRKVNKKKEIMKRQKSCTVDHPPGDFYSGAFTMKARKYFSAHSSNQSKSDEILNGRKRRFMVQKRRANPCVTSADLWGRRFSAGHPAGCLLNSPSNRLHIKK
jgi:hypothetical protein